MRSGADPCGMVRIRAEWCGSMQTGVESVLVRAESAESALSARIRAEHQGEGKLLIISIVWHVLSSQAIPSDNTIGCHAEGAV